METVIFQKLVKCKEFPILIGVGRLFLPILIMMVGNSRFSRVFSSRRDSPMKLSSIKGNCACAVLRATRGGFGRP